LQARVKKVLR